MTIVTGAVFLSRSQSVFRATTYLQPLFLFKEAWHYFSFVAWRNLILNILMFVPFGILLPLLSDKFKRLWKIVCIGFAASVLIESVQFMTGRGQASTDDVITNTLGALIGYGLIMAWQNIKNKTERSPLKIIGYLSPLCISVLVFISIFMVYHVQEFGNMPLNLHRQNMSNVVVSSVIELSEGRVMATVYQVDPLNRAQARDLAEYFFEQIGTSMNPQRSPIFYPNSAFFYSKNGGVLIVNFQTRTYRYVDFSSATEADSTLSEDKVRRLLTDFGVDIPTNAEFINYGDGQYIFTVDDTGLGQWLTGQLRIWIRKDGTIRQIDNAMFTVFEAAEREIISETEALRRIKEGRFQFWSHYEELHTVEVLSIALDYVFDTKGFYRPTYVFESLINDGEVVSIMIPAF